MTKYTMIHRTRNSLGGFLSETVINGITRYSVDDGLIKISGPDFCEYIAPMPGDKFTFTKDE